jgi:methylated-DNA-[protein]-cysteine S-methyltransferase
MSGHHVFDTAIGRCAILWCGAALTGVLLPERDDRALAAAIARRAVSVAAAPPAFARAAIDKIIALCGGGAVAFDETPLDRSAIDEFANRVYDVLLGVPFGATTTYGAIADAVGGRSLAQRVGAALGRNPFPIIIPCHRVVAADGALGGFSAPGGSATKRRLLAIEGAFRPETLPLFR